MYFISLMHVEYITYGVYIYSLCYGYLFLLFSLFISVWNKMLEFKKKELEVILSVDLPTPSKASRDTIVATSSLTTPTSVGNPVLLK